MKNTQYNAYLWPNRRNLCDFNGNRGRGTRWWRKILDRKLEILLFRACAVKNTQ